MKKRRQKRVLSPRGRTLTAVDTQNIRTLADQLGKLVPLSGYRSTFSLSTLAKANKLTRYLPRKAPNKKEAFANFLEQLQRHKPRTIKKLVRQILPRAIEKRHAHGDPVLETEALALSQQLKTLGIDLGKEILLLNLPKERPRVIPPPIAIQKILDSFPLHSALLPDCKKQFIDGHLNESVRKSLERFEKTVQRISGVSDKQGPDLMAHVFSETNPIIRWSTMKTPQERNQQIGFKFFTMGIMHWWRNNLSHGDEPQLFHHEAVVRLMQVSNLFHQLDSRLP